MNSIQLPPDSVWLQWDDCQAEWSMDLAFDNEDVEYIRCDIHEKRILRLDQEIARLRNELEIWRCSYAEKMR
jgi:hypothetical protein